MAFSVLWPRFKFYDQVEIDGFHLFSAGTRVGCYFAVENKIFLGTSDGAIFVLDRKYAWDTFHTNMMSVEVITATTSATTVYAAGQDITSSDKLIKQWEKNPSKPWSAVVACKRKLKYPNNENGSTVTALVPHPTVTNCLIIGMSCGRIYFWRSSMKIEAVSLRHCVHESKMPITNLLVYKCVENRAASQHMSVGRPSGVRMGRETRRHSTIHVYATTMDRIMLVEWTYANRTEAPKTCVVDQSGCDVNCCSTVHLNTTGNQFGVAVDEAVNFFDMDSRQSCFALSGRKLAMRECGPGKIALLMKVDESGGSDIALSESLQLFDVDLKLNTGAFTFESEQIAAVFRLNRCAHVLQQDGRMFRMEERPTQEILQSLMSKSMWSTAIELAKLSGFSKHALNKVRVKFADHLCSRGMHDEALVQFNLATSKTNTSLILRKLMSFPDVSHLTDYLLSVADEYPNLLLIFFLIWALNRRFLTSNYRGLDKLRNRIVSDSKPTSGAVGLLEADAQRPALMITESEVSGLTSCANVAKWVFGRLGSRALKDQMVDVLFKCDLSMTALLVCSNDREMLNRSLSMANKRTSNCSLSSYFDKYADLIDTEIFSTETFFSQEMFETAPELGCMILKQQLTHTLQDTETRKLPFLIQFACLRLFAIAPEQLLSMLADVVKIKGCKNPMCLKHVVDQLNLLETASGNICTAKSSPIKFNTNVLILVESLPASDKVIHDAYWTLGLEELAIDCCLKCGNFEEVVSRLRDRPPHHINTWMHVLERMSSDRNAHRYLREIVQLNLKLKAIPFQMIVEQLCGASSTVELGDYCDILREHLLAESRQSDENMSLIGSYSEECSACEARIVSLKTQPQSFQSLNCDICDNKLHLPSIHFMCSHSFHQRCFQAYEEDGRCQKCWSDHSMWTDMAKSRSDRRSIFDRFHEALKDSEDPVKAVASGFVNGIFDGM